MEGVRNYQRNVVLKRTARGATEADGTLSMTITYGHSVAVADRDGGIAEFVLEEQKIGDSVIFFYGICDEDVQLIDRAKIFRPVPDGEVLDEQDLKREAREIIERVYDMAVSTQQAQVREQSTGGSATHKFQRRAKKVIQKVKDLAKSIKKAPERKQKEGSFAVALILSSGWLMVADFGDYTSVVSVAGKAIKKSDGSLKNFAVKITEIANRIRDGTFKRRLGLNIISREMDFDTNFIVLASDGLRQAMHNQEAVALINNIVDAQYAAEYLSTEASKIHTECPISCMAICTREDAQSYRP